MRFVTPIERYFSPDLIGEDSAQRQRISHKLQLCPEKYLPIIEATIDGRFLFAMRHLRSA